MTKKCSCTEIDVVYFGGVLEYVECRECFEKRNPKKAKVKPFNPFSPSREVVECWDCKNYDKDYHECDWFNKSIDPDFYCSYGERREL